jgi:hypothetical protein
MGSAVQGVKLTTGFDFVVGLILVLCILVRERVNQTYTPYSLIPFRS